MSLIHADNFNIYGTSTAFMLNGRYSSVSAASIVTDPDGVSTGKVIRFSGNGGMRRAMVTPTNKVGLGLRLWLNSLPSDTAMRPTPMLWSDATNQNMFRIMVNTTGSITASIFDTTSGSFGNWFDIATTASPVVTANAWWHLEGVFDGSALTFELRVEGTTVLSLNSTDFAGHLHNGPDVYQYSCNSAANGTGGSINTHIKDYFAWDGLGSLNNTFLGSCLVVDLKPDVDTSIGGWVPSTGTTAWNILNQQVPGTTPNVAGGTPVPAAMSMTLTDLPANVTSVKGMITVVRAAKVDGGDGQLQISTLSGASTGAGANRAITTAQTYWEDVSELDPATAAQWTPVGVNAMGLKVDRTL